MPVKKDASGRRSVEAEVEVPGTPEEVWRAIATGPGISSWFVPTRLEERTGGVIRSNFGPNMESVVNITEWKPPHRYVADSGKDMAPGDPDVATEWVVEAKSGGTCVVRVVHSWFASTDDWDDQFEGHQHGWGEFFEILRLYLAHHRGQPAHAFQFLPISSESKADAWSKLTGELGLAGARAGARVTTSPSAPRLSGVVDHVGPERFSELVLVRLDEPGPGLASLFAMPMGGVVLLVIRIYLYGDRTAEIATREEAAWRAWLEQRFPPASPG